MRAGAITWAVAVAAAVFGTALTGMSRTSARAQQSPAVMAVSFNRDIRPILANNCFYCHGPDEKHRETRFTSTLAKARSPRLASSSLAMPRTA